MKVSGNDISVAAGTACGIIIAGAFCAGYNDNRSNLPLFWRTVQL